MRQTFCPRCDNLLSRSGHCSICGYQVKVTCHHCGHLNIPTAKYCGGCGRGTTFSVRYRRVLNSIFNPFQQIKIKRFFGGIAFGTLLALFAFSSMGMKYYAPEAMPDEKAVVPVLCEKSVLNSNILKSFDSDLEEICSDKDRNKIASTKELCEVMDVMIKNLNHIAFRTNKKRYPLDNAESYLEQEHSIKKAETTTRGNTAILFFAYLSDLFELKYKDFAKGSSYTDIPRFNIMEAPSSALKSYDIKISASDDRFGVNDEITLDEICKAARRVAIHAVQKANKEAPDLTTPPEIIIE